MDPVEIDVAPWNDRLVATLKEKGAIRSALVEAAFRRVQRHRLLEHYFQWQDIERKFYRQLVRLAKKTPTD